MLTAIIQQCRVKDIYINDGDILVIKTGLYIDQRTTIDPETRLKLVLPICFLNEFYYYVCPDCQHIHKSHITGKIQTECCDDIDCERTVVLKKDQKAEYFLVKRQPIILDDYPLI